MVNQDIGTIYEGSRICKVCKDRKDINEFHWTASKIHRVRTCKPCQHSCQEKRKQSVDINIRRRIDRKGFLRRRYGLTLDEFEKLWDMQDGLCAICKNELNREGVGKDYPQIDHCHDTGNIRGILCFGCNTAIGKFNDRIELLVSAIQYLESKLPKITLIEKKISKQELALKRSMLSLAQHATVDGQQKLKLRKEEMIGENGLGSKFSDSMVKEIIQRYNAGGISQQKLAFEYNVSQGWISSIVLGKIRKN